ncbi:MAG: hypothetical protein P0Y60_14650 [Candidatus Microbacterium colombiense]|nr:MAG: hypothetical protein P0Y60_14650 [Microbacterium sp.]
MTHFIAAVAVPPSVSVETSTRPRVLPFSLEAIIETEPSAELGEFLSRALARFDENREVERWTAKADIIAEGRRSIDSYRDSYYDEALSLGEAGYRAARPHAREAHFQHVFVEFPKRLEWSDEEVYAHEIEEWDTIREDGARFDTDNPDARWDWWTIGGRWEENFRTHQGETIATALTALRAALSDIESGQSRRPEPVDGRPIEDPDRRLEWWFPRGLVIESGDTFEWIAQGSEGWFGMTTDDMTEADWIRALIAAAESLDENTRLVYIDFHI